MIAARRIKALHLRSAQEELLQRGALLIEDGLRIATLPEAESARLYIVRRLSLGGICAGASSSSAALVIEKRFRQLGASAVHAEDPRAADAPAVYFHDEVEPYASLAIKIARGNDTATWFWKSAIPGWQAGRSSGEALRWLLYRSLQTGPGSAAAVRMVQNLLLTRALPPLLAALQPEDGASLLLAFGWLLPAASPQQPFSVESPGQQIGPHSAVLLKKFSADWGPADARTVWLASLLLVIAKPSLRHSFSLASRAGSLIEQTLSADQTVASISSRSACVEEAAAVKEDAPPPKVAGHEERMENEFRQERIPHSVAQPQSTAEPVATLSGEDAENIVERPAHAHDRSCRAGLFFLLAVMERTGLPQWMEEHGEGVGADFPAEVLRTIAWRLETPSNDPALLALPEDPEELSAAAWGAARLWLSRLRVYCRRIAGIGLHTLVCRSGRIAATPTHLDIYFPASDADIRVRRAGLDLNLGWLPWFGRVVNFHYLSRGDYDA